MRLVRSISQMKQISARWAVAGEGIVLVPTMGALHEGHRQLVRAARKSEARVVVSIFVNPLQFGPKEDFRRYPRNMKADARLLAREGVDVLFIPSARHLVPEVRHAGLRWIFIPGTMRGFSPRAF
jgi:pantoate--beta-alanine ligase